MLDFHQLEQGVLRPLLTQLADKLRGNLDHTICCLAQRHPVLLAAVGLLIEDLQLFLDLFQLWRHLDFAFLCRTRNADGQDGNGLAEVLECVEPVQRFLHDADRLLPILEAVSLLMLVFHLANGRLHLLVDDIIFIQRVDVQHGHRAFRFDLLIGFLQKSPQAIVYGQRLLIIRNGISGRYRRHEFQGIVFQAILDGVRRELRAMQKLHDFLVRIPQFLRWIAL